MAAKQLLPTYGGSAAVWMTCLVFFQIALLAGYLYAHFLASGSRSHAALHIALLALAAVAAGAWGSGLAGPHLSGTNPVRSIFAALALSIGLPFLMLASTSPLLQVWHARLQRGAIPFRLFALSNLASLLALLSYPALIEPNLSLSHQRALWAAGVAVFAVITAVLAWRSRLASPQPEDEQPVTQPPASPVGHRLLWFLLPMAAAMQLAAVTAHLTSNIAAIPLLWILPLAVYLLTFILAFQFPGLASYRGILIRLLAILLGSLGYLLSHIDTGLYIGAGIFFFLLEAFLACLFCHTETYALRPANARESTLFYLTIGAGGATGSLLVGVVAPLVFSGNYDLALTFLATAALVLAVMWQSGWAQRLLWATGTGLLVFLVFALHTAYHHNALLTTRNFYSSLRVTQTVTEHGDPIRALMNGSIEHGSQIFSPDLRHVPTTYYAADSGAGLALHNCCAGRSMRVGVIGLGAGTLAAYGRPGDSFRFYEINPAVLPIAQNLFTWLRDSGAALSFVQGDARTSLASEPPQRFDILVVDAFSGDAIPLHLLTVEAMTLYRRHLVPGGVMAFHVSNAYVNLEPEIAQLAAAANLEARSISSRKDEQSGEFSATWVLVTDNDGFLNQAEIAQRATTIPPVAHVGAWTDDYSSLLPLVRWR